MSWRTAVCGLLQNEQRYSRLLKSNNETSRFTHIARSPRKEVGGSAFALACRTTSLRILQQIASASRTDRGATGGYQPLGWLSYTHNPSQ
jgi:hypothetical protein